MRKIGIVGYSGQKFDIDLAQQLLTEAISNQVRSEPVAIVSGLTNLGIPKLAYEIAQDFNLTTVGIACSKAKDYECFPCDEVIIAGDKYTTSLLVTKDSWVRASINIQFTHTRCENYGIIFEHKVDDNVVIALDYQEIDDTFDFETHEFYDICGFYNIQLFNNSLINICLVIDLTKFDRNVINIYYVVSYENEFQEYKFHTLESMLDKVNADLELMEQQKLIPS